MLAAVLLGMGVDGLCRVVGGMHGVAVGHRRVMGGVVGLSRCMVDRRLLVMLSSLTVVLESVGTAVVGVVCNTTVPRICELIGVSVTGTVCVVAPPTSMFTVDDSGVPGMVL